MVGLFLVRYGVNGVFALELFLIPLLLTPAYYSSIEYTRNALALAQFALMGAYTGYVYKFYQDRTDHFVSLLIGSSVVAVLTGISYGILFKSVPLAAAAICIILSVVIEKRLQIYRCFVYASLFRAISSIVLIVAAYCASRSFFNLPAADLYGYALITAFLLWSGFCFKTLKMCSLEYQVEKESRFHWASVWVFIKKGFIVNLATQFLSYYLFYDRFLITNKYSNYIGGYSLAFNVSQLVFVGLNTISFVYMSDIGDMANDLNKRFLARKLAAAGILLTCLYILGAIACFVYSCYVKSYFGLFNSYLVIASLFGAYYAVSVISSAVLFTNTSNHLAIILGIVLLIKIGIAKLVFPLITVDYFQYLLFSGAMLLGAGIVTTGYIFKKLE